MVSVLMRAFMTPSLPSPLPLLLPMSGKPLSKQNANHINPGSLVKLDSSLTHWVVTCHFFITPVSAYHQLRLSEGLGREPDDFGFGGAKTPIVCYTWTFPGGRFGPPVSN